MFTVKLLRNAEADLEELHLYIEMHDSVEQADTVLDSIEKVISELAAFPEQGHFPPELLRISVRVYREVPFKPYRIIYSVHEQIVVIYCILDGRRDMQSLLQDRLLR